MWQAIVELLSVIQFALSLLNEHERVKAARATYQLTLFQALKKAKDDAEKETADAKAKGPDALADDTDYMLGK
jgi:hypothetical protein